MKTQPGLVILLLAVRSLAAATAELDAALVDRAASNAPSLFLNATQRVQSIRTFLTVAQIKGSSGQEQMIREEVKRLLTSSGAVEVPLPAAGSNLPLNLVLEFPATGGLTHAPGLLLNAHLDTLAQSTPENIAFDPESGDFYHRFQMEKGPNSSFGGDDRSGVAAIVAAVRFLQANHWAHGVAHRRIVLVFTADEERGCIGARHLARNQPGLFDHLELSLTMMARWIFAPTRRPTGSLPSYRGRLDEPALSARDGIAARILRPDENCFRAHGVRVGPRRFRALSGVGARRFAPAQPGSRIPHAGAGQRSRPDQSRGSLLLSDARLGPGVAALDQLPK